MMVDEDQRRDSKHSKRRLSVWSNESQDQDLQVMNDVKEQIIATIGPFGKWQLLKCLYVVLIIWMPGAFHVLKVVFFRSKTDFWCSKPQDSGNFQDWSDHQWINFSSPLIAHGENMMHDRCKIYDIDYEKLFVDYEGNMDRMQSDQVYIEAVMKNLVRQCGKWSYDRSFWASTIVMEWDLVCDREPLQKLTQQLLFLGLLFGAFVSGILSDKYGRVPTMIGLLAVSICTGIAQAFSPNYEFFLMGIWISGFTSIGFGTVMYCWMIELISGTQKTIFGCAPHFNFAFWGLAVAGLAYILPDWHKMELAYNITVILLLATYWILPESPRWLLFQGRISEAEATLKRIRAFNGQPLDKNFNLHLPPHNSHHTIGKGIFGFLELFKTPNLRMKTLIIYFLWFSSSIVYYGLTLNSNDFGASLFVYFSLGKAIEFPTIFIVTILLLKSGRRLSIVILKGICATCLLATMAIPTGYFHNEWPIVTMNIIGRGSSIGCMAICYVYSAEIFPTVIRNVGVGSSSVWARVGPMIAPFIADLSSIDPRLPIGVFGVIALIAGFLATFLPETAHHKLPDSIAEGESMGRGDTLWTHIFSKIKGPAVAADEAEKSDPTITA